MCLTSSFRFLSCSLVLQLFICLFIYGRDGGMREREREGGAMAERKLEAEREGERE